MRLRRPFAALILAAALASIPDRPAHAVLDIDDKGPVLQAGGFALRVTNAGIIGNAFLDKGLSFDPSFEIHPGSGAEALNRAEFWVGAIGLDGLPHVSGGPMLEWRPTLAADDRVHTVNIGTPGTRRNVDDDGDGQIDEEILNGKDDDGDGEVDEDLGLVAQQTMGADYADDNPGANTSPYEVGESHVPLGISVHQEAYAWSAPGYQGIAGLSFHVTNHGNGVLRNVRIGLYADLDSRRREDRGGHLNDRIEYHSYTRGVFEGIDSVTVNGVYLCGGAPPCPPVPPCITTLKGTVPVLHDDRDPHLPWVAVVPLRHTTDPLALIPPALAFARAPGQQSFLTSVFGPGRIPGQGGPPNTDADRYRALSGTYPTARTDIPDDYAVLVSCGPFVTLSPGQSLDFEVALVGTVDADSIDEQIGNAAVLHHGEMVNRLPDARPDHFPSDYKFGESGINGHEVCLEPPAGGSFEWDPNCPSKIPSIDPIPEQPVLYTHGHCIWTDADCDRCTGILGLDTRLYWGDPGQVPIAPNVRLVSQDHAVRIEWDNRPEVLSASGFSGASDLHFGGYRVYRLTGWDGRSALLPPAEKWALIGAFGADTLRDGERSLASITDTTLDYDRILYERRLYPIGRYAVADSEVLNGFDYGYVVTTVMERRTVRFEHTFVERFESPFTPHFDELVQPHAAARGRGAQAWVVPNPFRAHADWDRPPVLGDPLTRHLDFMGLPRARAKIKIWTVSGDLVATLDHDGSGGDGQAPWNLVSRNGQEIESGIYLFTIDSALGHQTGHFVVIR